MQGPTIKVGNSVCTIYYTKGKVVGRDKNFETKVYGGGGATYRGTGGAVSISSTTYIHDKIYLEHENGKQTAIELTDWDIACLEGHEMLAFWLIKEGDETGPYVGIKNLTTDDIRFKKKKIKDMFKMGGLSIFFFIMGWIALEFIVLVFWGSFAQAYLSEYEISPDPMLSTMVAITVLAIILAIIPSFNKQKNTTSIINQVKQFINTQELSCFLKHVIP